MFTQARCKRAGFRCFYVEDEQGKGVIGVIDGYASKGIEDAKARKERYEFLRKIGYKLGTGLEI